MLAMYHDYRIMNPSKGFLCINELEFGVPLTPPMSSIFRQKLSPQVYSKMVLEAHRWGGAEALKNGIVDALGGLEEVVKLVEGRKLTEKGNSGVYGQLKREMWRETLGYLEESGETKLGSKDDDEHRKTVGAKRVAEWKKSVPSPKL